MKRSSAGMQRQWAGLLRGRKKTGLFAVTLTVATACVACTGSSGNGPSGNGSTGNGGTIVWGKQAEPDVLDPAAAGSSNAWELLHVTYQGLVGLDDTLGVVPDLAESWRQTSPTTYVFTLRKGVRFSNGREMSADDVVGSLRRLMNPKTASLWAGQLGGIREVATGSPTEVTVTLKAPRTTFLPALAGVPAAILPMKELNSGTFDPKKSLLGTGPYKAVAHSQGESWTFERNPYYWRTGEPATGNLRVRILPDDAARAAALRNEAIDVTTFEAPDSVRLLKGQANVKTVIETTTDYYNLSLSAKSPIFRDQRLRQALALSIDRERIRTVALAGIGRPTAAASVAFGNVCDPRALPFSRPDVQRARSLVEAAGAVGKTVRISILSTVPMSSAIAQVLQQNLQSAGLKTSINTIDPGQRAKESGTGKFDAFVGWFAGYADPAMSLIWWNPELAGWNKTWAISDKGLNESIEKSLSTTPGPDRTRAIQQACEHIAEDANIIPVVSKDVIVAYRIDKLDAQVQPREGYGVPLRHLADFRVK
jgi:peptide/nickel transport system substrate-binding protein